MVVLFGNAVKPMAERLPVCDSRIQPRCVVGQVMVKVEGVGVMAVNAAGAGGVAMTGVAVAAVDWVDS